MRPWSNFPPNIDSRWLVWITLIAWTWPLLYPRHIINFQNGAEKNPIGFGIISGRREEQQKRAPEEWRCTFPESSCTQILPKAVLCEMECEMSAFNIPAVDYTVHIMLRRGSRASSLSPGSLSSTFTSRYPSRLTVYRVPTLGQGIGEIIFVKFVKGCVKFLWVSSGRCLAASKHSPN